MNKTEQPDALALARIHANGLRERNTELLALLYGVLALLDCGDTVNSGELLRLAIDNTGGIGGFQGLECALNELGASHE